MVFGSSPSFEASISELRQYFLDRFVLNHIYVPRSVDCATQFASGTLEKNPIHQKGQTTPPLATYLKYTPSYYEGVYLRYVARWGCLDVYLCRFFLRCPRNKLSSAIDRSRNVDMI